ncbi:MAG: hypothetical protein WBA97_16755 [Actinophytocola sp.]|uniref:hypothetical protein n=1 Tax=Actinophytocola sp. TaxID=1872138 RepID=UPI003C73A703
MSANQSTVENAPWDCQDLDCSVIAEAPAAAPSFMGGLHLGLRLRDGTVSYSHLSAPA